MGAPIRNTRIGHSPKMQIVFHETTILIIFRTIDLFFPTILINPRTIDIIFPPAFTEYLTVKVGGFSSVKGVSTPCSYHRAWAHSLGRINSRVTILIRSGAIK